MPLLSKETYELKDDDKADYNSHLNMLNIDCPYIMLRESYVTPSKTISKELMYCIFLGLQSQKKITFYPHAALDQLCLEKVKS